jgi:hypothetical protein
MAASSNSTGKKGRKKKEHVGGGGGGFGSSSSPIGRHHRSDEDVMGGPAVYPDLESHILETLVSSTFPIVHGSSSSPPGGGSILPGEIYDRLDGIYGFDKFNFGGDGALYRSVGGTTAPVLARVDDDHSSTWSSPLEGGASDEYPWPSLLTSSSSSSSSSIGPGNVVYDLNSIPPFRRFRVLHVDPMVLAIDDFFTPDECDTYVRMSIDSSVGGGGGLVDDHAAAVYDNDDPNRRRESHPGPVMIGQSRTVGKDARSRAQRTSTTWFHHYAGVPELLAKACRLLGLNDHDDVGRFEEPQTVRYRGGERFTWHLDALPPEETSSDGGGGGGGAGQRVATLLVYLTDLSTGEGGSTMFRDLGVDGMPLRV